MIPYVYAKEGMFPNLLRIAFNGVMKADIADPL